MKKTIISGIVAAVMSGSLLGAAPAVAEPIEVGGIVVNYLDREQKTEPKSVREAQNPTTREPMRTVREVKKAGDGKKAPIGLR